MTRHIGHNSFILSSLQFFVGPPQPALLYQTDGGALTYRPVASQLALSSTRYGPTPGSYHLGPTTSAGTLQHLTHFSSGSTPFQYVTTPQNTGQPQGSSFPSRHSLPGVAYGPVLTGSQQPSYLPSTLSGQSPQTPGSTVASGLTAYNVGYGPLTTTTSSFGTQQQSQIQSLMQPPASIDRLPNAPPSYDSSQESFSSHPLPTPQSRHQWNSPSFP